MSEKIVPQHLVFSFEPTVGLDQVWTFFFFFLGHGPSTIPKSCLGKEELLVVDVKEFG